MIHNLGTVDLRFEYQPFGIHQKMALSTLNLLATVVSTLLSAHPSRLDRLGIHYACARLRISLQANPKAFPDSPVDPLPTTVDAPFPEIVVDSRPSRKVVGK